MVLLRDATLVQAVAGARRLQAALDGGALCVPGIGRVTASFGVAAPRRSDHSVYEIVARADRALYAAKAAGRNRVMADGEAIAAAPARSVALQTPIP